MTTPRNVCALFYAGKGASKMDGCRVTQHGAVSYSQERCVCYNTSWTLCHILFSCKHRWSYGVVLWEIFTYGMYPHRICFSLLICLLLLSCPSLWTQWHSFHLWVIAALFTRGQQTALSTKLLWRHVSTPSVLTLYSPCMLRYQLMLQCWHQSPAHRPSFTELVDCFSRFLNISQVSYLFISFTHLSSRPQESDASSITECSGEPSSPTTSNTTLPPSNIESLSHNHTQCGHTETEVWQLTNIIILITFIIYSM